MSALQLFHNKDILSKDIDLGSFEAQKLGLNENEFKVLKLVLRLLDTVFRFANKDYFQGAHNSVAEHSIAMAKKIEQLFEPISSQDGIDETNFRAIEEAKKSALLSALVHDAGEGIMEFSTVDGRAFGPEVFSGEDRHKMERSIAAVIFDLAVKAVQKNDESILVKPIQKARKDIKKGQKSIREIVASFIKENPLNRTRKDAEVLMKAFNRAENREDLMGVLVKVIDTMDGNSFLVERSTGSLKKRKEVVYGVMEKMNSLKNILVKIKILIESAIQDLTENAIEFVRKHELQPSVFSVCNTNP